MGARNLTGAVPGPRRWQPRHAREREATSRRAFRTFIGVAAVICLSAIAVLVQVSVTAVPDLFDLVPKVPRSNGYVLLAWNQLERGDRALRQGVPFRDTPVRVLGYMMDGDEPIAAGQPVARFVLVPDAGSVRAAHRFGDQMLDVRLRVDETAHFCNRCLFWVWGTLKMLPGDPIGPKPVYCLENARTELAHKADIPKYFR